MRNILLGMLALSGWLVAGAQDVDPLWPFESDSPFAYEIIEPSFESGGVHYFILHDKDHEVAVMNNATLCINRSSEISLNFQGLNWTIDEPYAGHVVVPPTVSHDGVDYDVTTVMYGAFAMSPDLLSVSLPESVTRIRDGIFAGCTSLQRAEFPSSLQRLPGYTFVGCTALKSIDLSAYPQQSAFTYSGCFGIEEVITTGSKAELGVLMERFLTRMSMLREPDISGSLRRVYVTDPDAAYVDWTPGPFIEGPLPNEPFADGELENATLYVPAGSKAAFEAAPLWRQFARIEEGEYAGIISAEADGSPQVRVEARAIHADGLEGTAAVFDTAGRLVATLGAACPSTPPLEPGIYIVRAYATALKVFVGR